MPSDYGGLRRLAAVIFQQPAESLIADNFASRLSDRRVRLDQPVAEALVIALPVIVSAEMFEGNRGHSSNRPAEVGF